MRSPGTVWASSLPSVRRAAYFALFALRGQAVGLHYRRMLHELCEGIPLDTTRQLLVQMLAHCQHCVPYYASIMDKKGASFYENPQEYLADFPILTKSIIRDRFDELKSSDLWRRRWYVNTSGGSTGEPARFIQDWDYFTRSGSVTLLFSFLAGRQIGELEVELWGSRMDLRRGTQGWRAKLVNNLSNTVLLNAFRMTPAQMRDYIALINATRPKLILAYVNAIYDLARLAERERLEVVPQTAVMTSAGTLFPVMREKVERVFGCRVFDRYGSREVGDIACERPDRAGFWVAPWGNYVEIVDADGKRLPDGTEGDILVTSLTNFAMPLIRYRIGDRGILAARTGAHDGTQVLQAVLGRTSDAFRTNDGAIVNTAYFINLLFFRPWIWKYQVVQKSCSQVVFRFALAGSDPPVSELDDIRAKTKLVMGDDCEVGFEFMDDIPVSGSDKYRYTISEVAE